MPLRIAQYGFSGGEIAESLFGRTDVEKYALSLRVAKNVIVTKFGGVLNRAGTRHVGEVKDSADYARLIPFQFSTSQAYVLEFADGIMRPIKDAGQVLEAAKNVVTVSTASQLVVTITGHGWSDGDHVFCDDAIGGITTLHERVCVISDKTTDTFKLKDLYGNYIASTGLTYTSGGTISRLYQQTIPFTDDELFDVGYTQTADTMYLTHLNYAPRKMTRTGHASWTVTSVTFGPTLSAPGGCTATATSGTGSTTYLYKITAIDDDLGEESLPSTSASCVNDLTVAGYFNTITWPTVSGAERYIVYKADNGVYGLIGGTESASFIDVNYLPDLGDTPPQSRNPFASASSYPKVCEFHEGRLGYFQTINNPAAGWLSQSGRYENFNVSTPAKDDDAVSFQLRPGVNAIQGVASLNKRMAAFTSEREFTISGGGQTTYITPASLLIQPATARGSSNLKPLVVGDIVLFVQRQGATIRAFGYSFEKDGFRTNDLTLLAPHLFRGHRIVDWCYQQDPDSIVWCVRDDGVLLALTFVEDQNTFAWTRCYLGGTFGFGASATGYGVAESCCSIEGDTQDDVYLLVKRTINSQTKRYIEKLDARWIGETNSAGEVTNVEEMYFLDCGITFTSAAATSTVTGLYHLEGQSVYALVDGNVQGPFTVSAGRITLSSALVGTNANANSQAHVGLAYVSDIADLPISMQTATGAPQGREKSVNAVVLKLHMTRGVKVGPYADQDKAYELKERDLEDWDDPIQPYSGDTTPIKIGSWSLDGSVLIRQSYPLPMEVTMIAKDVTVTGP